MRIVEIKDDIIDVDTIISISNVVYNDIRYRFISDYVSHYFIIKSLAGQIVIRNIFHEDCLNLPTNDEIQKNKEYVESLRTQLLDIWGGNASQIIKIA